MIEIGTTKTIKVRAKIKGKLVPVTEADGSPVTKTVSASVWRMTRDSLGGNFGPDRHRKLVVGLTGKDQLVLRPQGSRRSVNVNLVDVYRWALRCEANRAVLEKARASKERKAIRLAEDRAHRASMTKKVLQMWLLRRKLFAQAG